MRATNIDARGLRDYLTFLDRTYGRLAAVGLPGYAARRYGRLKLSKVRAGSWEIAVVVQLIETATAAAVVVVGLLLKYLPTIITASSGAFKNYQEGMLTREKRRELRAAVNADERLRAMTASQRQHLVAIHEALVAANPRDAWRAASFASEHVQDVQVSAVKTERASASERP